MRERAMGMDEEDREGIHKEVRGRKGGRGKK